VRVKDMQIEPEGASAEEFRWADLVGISADTTRMEQAMRIARQAAGFGRPVVMGGPHPQFMPADVLGSGHVGYIIKGEGDQTFPNLLSAIERRDDPASVAGIIYRDGGRVIENVAAPLPEIETLPLPARHLVPLDRYSASISGRGLTPIITSRGCPSACRFCSSSGFFGTRWRSRSVEAVLSELDEVYNRYGFRAVAFTDDNFTLDPGRVVAIAEGIRQRGYDLKWWNFSRVDTIVRHPEMVRAMAAAGSYMVYLGIESESDATLKSLGKRSSAGEAGEAVRLLQGNGIEAYGSYMIGDVNESRAEVEKTIAMAARLDTNIAQFSILTPYPGTALYEELKSRIFLRRWKFYDGLHLVFRHPRINRHLMQYLLIKAYVKFYRRSRKAKDGFKQASRRSSLTFRKILTCAYDLFF